jgi:hypothetical protein
MRNEDYWRGLFCIFLNMLTLVSGVGSLPPFLLGMFTSEVQFGHAGSCANSDRETAAAKNKALSEAGAHVPQSFDSLGEIIHDVYDSLVQSGAIVPEPEVPPPTVPMDYSWARVSS